MKLILKIVHPLDRKTFGTHILKCLALQLLFVTIVYIVIQNKNLDIEKLMPNREYFYYAYVLHFLMLLFVYDVQMYRGRFKDIYPDLELNKIFYFLVGFVPVFFFALTLFLCVKGSEAASRSYPRAFKIRYYLLALGVLLSLKNFSPKVSVLTSVHGLTHQVVENMQKEPKREIASPKESFSQKSMQSIPPEH